jgi:DNA polymerase
MKIGKDGSRAFSVAGGRIVFKRRGSFLFCRLPSGRALCYCYPKIRSKKTPWGKDKQTLFYSGVDTSKGAGGKWCDIATYGGKLTENCVQASARDLLRDAMIRVEAAGYPIVMHVHDEIVSEVPNGFGSHEEFLQLMSICPSWAAGLPVAAGGWEGVRYRKD